jgi:hypothetical protein
LRQVISHRWTRQDRGHRRSATGICSEAASVEYTLRQGPESPITAVRGCAYANAQALVVTARKDDALERKTNAALERINS